MEFVNDPYDKQLSFAATKEALRYIFPTAQNVQLSGPDGAPIQHNVQITQESKDRISKLVDAITQNAKTSGAI